MIPIEMQVYGGSTYSGYVDDIMGDTTDMVFAGAPFTIEPVQHSQTFGG
jgi:hypothetical protein